MHEQKINIRELFNVTVVVSALGYFVDIYDLILFGIVRKPSLSAIGITTNQIDAGVLILNMQMAGMLIGGIFWGVLGDKKGRISVLFGSILMYSLANFANAFVQNISQYAILRFIAGFGLAGELGAAITLVSEVMRKETRGFGAALVSTIGVTGAIFAALVGEYFNWQTAYIIGGLLGFGLLILRIKMSESGMFAGMKDENVSKGNFFALFYKFSMLKRYFHCIAIGLPIWFVVGVLITFSPEFAKELGYRDAIIAGRSIMFTYTGLIFGDFISGFASQLLHSRKKVVLVFILVTAALVGVYLYFPGKTAAHFYTLCVLLGYSVGYWAVFTTIAAEQFGTNLRATVTTTVPNFVRGAVVPITLGFTYFRNMFHSMTTAALIVAIITFCIALFSLWHLKETFSEDLNYTEKI